MASSSDIDGADEPAKVVVGWIGLGSMGSAMAKNIQNHLTAAGAERLPLRMYHRTASRCTTLEEPGAKKCESIAELARDSDIMFISVSRFQISWTELEEEKKERKLSKSA